MNAPGLHTATSGAMTSRSEMNDRSPTAPSTTPPISSWVTRPDVLAFQVDDALVGSKSLVQLAVPDVDGHDLGRAPLQEAIGEPAGRRAGVEQPRARTRRGRNVERMVELLGAPTDEAGRRTVDDDGIARRHLARRLGGDSTVDEDPVGVDQPLGCGAARCQLTADEFGVEPTTGGHRLMRSARRALGGDLADAR